MIKNVEMRAAVGGVRRGARAHESEARRRQVESLETWSVQDREKDVGREEVGGCLVDCLL